MVGLFPHDFVMSKKPQGHGYTTLEVARDNPYFPPGTLLKGHEFHYSQIVPDPGPEAPMAFTVIRGTGIGGQREGSSSKTSWPLIPTSTPWVAPIGPRPWCAGPGIPRRYRPGT